MNDANMDLAVEVYDTICEALDIKEWRYDKNDSDLLVRFGVRGDDITMSFYIKVDAERQLIRLSSPLPFDMSFSGRVESSVAVCVASYGMCDGSFDYDHSDATISFRMAASFRNSFIGVELIQYLIDCSCTMVDKYYREFLALETGSMSISDFIAKHSG